MCPTRSSVPACPTRSSVLVCPTKSSVLCDQIQSCVFSCRRAVWPSLLGNAWRNFSRDFFVFKEFRLDFSSRCLPSQPFPQMAPMEVCQPANTLLVSNPLYLGESQISDICQFFGIYFTKSKYICPNYRIDLSKV